MGSGAHSRDPVQDPGRASSVRSDEHPRVPRSSVFTVRFEQRGDATEVVVQHERIADQAARERHALGWHGCIEGLATLLESTPSTAG